jgi:hypothetical protein
VKILLALPTAGAPARPFLESLATLAMPPAATAFEQLTISGNFIPGQREVAARRALALDADVLIMLDDDMILPPHALTAVTDALRADPALAVVGALYYSRDGLRPMATQHWDSRDTTSAAVPAFGDGVAYVDGVGFGCVALRVSALRSLSAPYFSTQVYIEERAARVRICNEDYLYCARVRAAGFRVGLHGGVRCRHFDRASGLAQPAAWEDAAATSRERMMVVEPGPHFRLVPYDAGVARAPEQHAAGTLDYIIVD